MVEWLWGPRRETWPPASFSSFVIAGMSTTAMLSKSSHFSGSSSICWTHGSWSTKYSSWKSDAKQTVLQTSQSFNRENSFRSGDAESLLRNTWENTHQSTSWVYCALPGNGEATPFPQYICLMFIFIIFNYVVWDYVHIIAIPMEDRRRHQIPYTWRNRKLWDPKWSLDLLKSSMYS